MKQFLKFYKEDKQNFKIINQSGTGFELVILSDKSFKEFIEKVHSFESNNDTIDIMWQMKFKPTNFVLYKNCTFSDPMDNYFKDNLCGKKIIIKCDSGSYYSYSEYFINKKARPRMYDYRARLRNEKKKWYEKQECATYNNGLLLERMLKISQLNLNSNNEL